MSWQNINIKKGIKKEEVKRVDFKISNKIGKLIYRIKDGVFKFWYMFCYPNMSSLYSLETSLFFDDYVKNRLHKFASKTFEEISIKYLWILNNKKKLNVLYSCFGPWWGNVTKEVNGKKTTIPVELDIVGESVDKKSHLLGECKFINKAFDLSEYKIL